MQFSTTCITVHFNSLYFSTRQGINSIIIRVLFKGLANSVRHAGALLDDVKIVMIKSRISSTFNGKLDHMTAVPCMSNSGNTIILIVITVYLTGCLGQETTIEIFQYSSQASICQPVSHTRWRLHTVLFYWWTSGSKAVNVIIPNFIVIGSIRSGIEPESTVSVADTRSTRPLIGCYKEMEKKKNKLVIVVVVVHIFPPLTRQRQTLTIIGRHAHFSLL